MRRIYRKARRVIVWLGKDGRGDHNVVEKSICHLAELADKPMLDERVNRLLLRMSLSWLVLECLVGMMPHG